MDLVVMLHIREPLQHEGDWLVHAICLCLGKDCSGCEVGGIAFKAEATGLRWEGEDGGRGDSLLQGVRAHLRPGTCYILVLWSSDISVEWTLKGINPCWMP